MSLRRRDLFWQESEKGGGPGDGDTIVYAANVTRPGLVQKNLIWRSGLAQDIAFLSWTDNDRELLAGNPLLSPDGTYVIWPSVERVETTGVKQVPGIAGIYRGTNDTDWEVVTDPNGNRVLASKSGLGDSKSSIFTFMPEARVNLYVCTDGESGYDYLTVSQNGTELYNGSNQSQQGATSFRYTKLTVEPGTEVTLTYQKDLSNSEYSDRAYAYIGRESFEGTTTLDSTTWEVSGTLASGQTVYKSAIEGQTSTTASAYIRIQPTQTGSLMLMCRSNGEEGYDYLKVYELDSTTSVLKSFESETSATDYTAVEFNIPDTESHFIYVEYVKDYSGNSGEDAAFVYINTTVRYDMSSTVEATGTVTRYCRSFEKYKLDTGTRTAYTYSYSSTTPSDLLKTEYGVPQFLVPKTFDSDTVTFNEGHMSSSDYKYIPVYASARLSNTGLELTTGSVYTSESVMSQTQFLYGAVKYSDNGDLFCTIPLSGSFNSYGVSASEYFQSASKCVYLSRRANDTDYVSERILDLLPVDSGSTSTVAVDAAFNRTGKITYVVGNQLTESTVVTFYSHLYRSTDKTVSFEHLDWAPSDSSEYITAVCTNFSGKVVYVLTGTFSYNAWVSASVYRSEDYGRTFNRQNKFECKGPSYVSGSVGDHMDRLKAAVNALDPRYRMQIACSGKGDRLAVWLVSGSSLPRKNQGLIFRSDDSGLTWADPVETDRSVLDFQPRILIMNRN